MEVDTKLPDVEIEKALKGGIKELWEVYSSIEGDSDFEAEKHEVQYGIRFEFNIEKVVRGYVQEYPDTNRVKVRGYTKMDLDEYWDELRAREKIMRDTIRRLITDALDEQEEWEDDNK